MSELKPTSSLSEKAQRIDDEFRRLDHRRPACS